MWIVIYGRHWVYLKHKEFRFETKYWCLAILVYAWWNFRYSITVYPVRYIKMYKSDNDVINIKSYSRHELGIYKGRSGLRGKRERL